MRRMSANFLVCMLAIAIGCKKEQPGSGNVGAGDTGTVIKIGEVGSMTGTEATFGTSSHNGIQLATDEVNAAGGIKGKQIQVIALDDQGKPRAVPPLIPGNATERRRQREAKIRRETRLAHRQAVEDLRASVRLERPADGEDESRPHLRM